MCWDESWDDPWLLPWPGGWGAFPQLKSEQRAAVASAPPPLQRQEDHEARAAVREVTRLIAPRHSLTISRFGTALTAWLHHRYRQHAEPGAPQELIPTGRR